MIKYILVPATGSDTDLSVFGSALAIARRWAGHIEFLHVRVDVRQVLIAMASGDMGGGAGYDDILVSLEQDAANRLAKAERSVHDYCAREQIAITAEPGRGGVTAELRTELGEEPAWLAEHGRVADLLVLGRGREGEPVALDVLEAALLATGRPVLLAPAAPPQTLGKVVAIAWKDTREAARAVDAARSFIDTADRVVILSVQEEGAADDVTCDRLLAALCWHNPNTSIRRFQPGERHAPDVLLDAAGQVGADLLVMGGYSHSRLREMVLGGFTRHVLQSATMPVLMAH
jgi:nucleotide-binding universal stress UspA family protein